MDFEVKGSWWIPGVEDRKLHGTLRFSVADGATLELFGTFREWWDYGGRAEDERAGNVELSSFENPAVYGRLHGQVGGTAYTLEDCFRIELQQNLFSEHGFETVRVGQIIKGAFFSRAEELCGTGITFGLQHLEDWIAESGISEQWMVDRSHDEGPVARIEVVEIEERSTATSTGWNVALRHNPGMRGDSLRESALTQEFSWRIDGDDLVPIKSLLMPASHLQALVSIAVGRPAGFTSVAFWHPDLVHTRGDGASYPFSAEYFVNWRVNDGAAASERIHLPFFTFAQLGGIDGVQAWLEAVELHGSALTRAMASRDSNMFVTDRLFHCAAALEAFDRRRTGYRGSKFRVRILRCAEHAGPPFAALVPDAEAWVDVVRDRRDDIAHHLEREFADDAGTTYYLAQSLYWLFVMCMLRTSHASEELFANLSTHRELAWLRPRIALAIKSREREGTTRT